MQDKKVIILMATYNGAAYLEEQLQSIQAQTYGNFELLVRDDGSADATLKLLERYAAADSRIKILDNNGKKLGAAGNFLELLKKAKDADYYAFSDQDDIWHKDKLAAALNGMQEMEAQYGDDVPLLYCGAKTLVDGQMQVIGISRFEDARITWGNALVENLCTGCTCAINASLRRKAIKELPEYIVMHDWWFYLIAVAFGHVFYDTEPYIQYRQHSGNACGDIAGGAGLLRYRIGQLFAERGGTYKQIEEFLKIFGKELDSGQKKNAMLLAASRKNLRLRFRVLKNKEIFRQRKKDNQVLRFLILTGKL